MFASARQVRRRGHWQYETALAARQFNNSVYVAVFLLQSHYHFVQVLFAFGQEICIWKPIVESVTRRVRSHAKNNAMVQCIASKRKTPKFAALAKLSNVAACILHAVLLAFGTGCHQSRFSGWD